ncbi:MAG: sigma-70 family RNA polymerase sigma factor [Mariniblastus sp.]
MDGLDDKRDRVLRAALDCRSELIAYARSLLGNYAAAEDVLQEAMIVVVKKFDQFQEGTSILAWCRSIVRIEVLRAKQKYQRDRSLVDRLLDDAVEAAFEEFQMERHRDEAESWREALRHCLANVPERGHGVLKASVIGRLALPNGLPKRRR